MQTFSFTLPKKLSQEGNWLRTVSSLRTTKFFSTIDENNSFAIGILGYWRLSSYLEDIIIIEQLKNLLKPKSPNDIELHVQEVRKRRDQLKRTQKTYLFGICCF